MNQIISKKLLRNFGLVFGSLFPLVFGFLLPLLYGYQFRFWTLYIGFSILILGIIKPMLLYYPYKIWIKFGIILSWINTRLILGLIFILIVQPISIVMKLFGYDPLKKYFTNDSTYREIKKNYKIDLTRIF